MTRMPMALVVAALAGALALPALGADPPPRPTPHVPAALDGSSLAWCGDLEPTRAEPEAYRDKPVYVGNEMPAQRIRRWARTKPGFVDVWIDRERNGWVTAVFTEGAEARQAELEREFPGIGAVAVEVDNSRMELRRLAKRVGGFVEDRTTSAAYGFGSNLNTVTLDVNVVTPELIEALEAEFGGEPLCVSGPDPEDLPGTGPQPTSGDGWVLLGYEQGHGPAFETGIATDQQQYLDLWEEVGLDGAAPAVDFTDDIVVWFSEGHGSSCPDLRMDQVIVDVERAQVYPFIVVPGQGPMICTSDLVGAYQFVAAVERKALPEGPFEIGLGGGDGELFRSMQVGVDLSEPGSVATADDLGSPDERPATLRSGAVVETIGRSRYTFDVTCGIGYLGVINDTHWVTAEEMPAKWQTRVPEDGELSVTIRLRTEPQPHVRALRNGVEVRYEPAPEAPDGCDAQPASARLTLGSKRARLTSFS